jgi:hypothetical protein
VGALTDLVSALEHLRAEWNGLALRDLEFAQSDAARLVMIVLLGAAFLLLLGRFLLPRSRGRGCMALPALLRTMHGSRWGFVRHGAVLVALAGLVCFLVALGDPRTAVTGRDASHQGRRISLMIDASSSMLSALPSNALAPGAPSDAAFFTSVGAARYFVELRMNRGHHDLMSLIEFGDNSYVITPFTSDYQNILLSIALIGDWSEFMAFPDQGTTIARAIDQSVGLFQTFDFLDATGNLMVIFTDGSDAEVLEDGRSVFDVLREAERAVIPVYFIRTGGAAGRRRIPDSVWRAAVTRTGGRFYSAADEKAIVDAMHAIDAASPGRIDVRQYSTRVPRFTPFALAAVGLWILALAMRLTTPWFEKFP